MVRWAEIEISAAGDAQEIAGALLTDTALCAGYAATKNAVTGYLPVDDRLEQTLLELRERLSQTPEIPEKDLTIRFVAEEDWAHAWKQYFKPQRVGHRLVIKPSWEEFSPSADDLVLHLDPGMAFGTGLHATTRLCLLALEQHVRPGDRVADVGTGSGILAIAANLLGAGEINAVDIDPMAVGVAEKNTEINNATGAIHLSVRATPPPGEYEIVVANILADIILGMKSDLRAAVKTGGLLIASGIITTRADDVKNGLHAARFSQIEQRTDGDWVALLAR